MSATDKNAKLEGIKDFGFTIMYRESVNGGLYGFVKELPEAISEADDLESLRLMLCKAMVAIFEAKRIDFENNKSNQFDNNYNESTLLTHA